MEELIKLTRLLIITLFRQRVQKKITGLFPPQNKCELVEKKVVEMESKLNEMDRCTR